MSDDIVARLREIKTFGFEHSEQLPFDSAFINFKVQARIRWGERSIEDVARSFATCARIHALAADEIERLRARVAELEWCHGK